MGASGAGRRAGLWAWLLAAAVGCPLTSGADGEDAALRGADQRSQRDAALAAAAVREARGDPPGDGHRVIVVPYLDRLPLTGGERNIEFFVHGLALLGHRVAVLVPASPLRQKYEDNGIEVIAPPPLYIAERSASLFGQLASALLAFIDGEVARLAAAPSPEAAVADEAVAATIATTLKRLDAMLDGRSGAHTRIPVPAHDARSVVLRALQMRRLAQAADGPQVIVTDLIHDAVAAAVGLRDTPHRALYYPQMSLPMREDRFIAAYSNVATCGEAVAQARFGGRSARVTVVSNGVNTDLFSPQRRGPTLPEVLRPRSATSLRIGNVAHIAPRKNQLALVRACALARERLGDFDLFFIGDRHADDREGYGDRLLAAAREGGIAERVHLLGPLRELDALLPHLDIFVLPSLVEGMPLALLEAMSSGVASLASDIDGCRELAGPGVRLFAATDVHGLARQLVELAEAPLVRRRQGQAGRQQVEMGPWSQKQMLRGMDGAILALIARGQVAEAGAEDGAPGP